MGGCGGEQGWENRFSFFHAEMRDNMSPIFQSLSRLWLMQINYNFLIHINSQIVDAMRFSYHDLMIVLIITGRRFSCGWEGGLSNNRWWDAKWRAYNRLNRINQCRMPQQIFDINNSIHFLPPPPPLPVSVVISAQPAIRPFTGTLLFWFDCRRHTYYIRGGSGWDGLVDVKAKKE